MKGILLCVLCCLLPLTVSAGDLDAPAGPSSSDSAMYTLEDIYNRLAAGTPGEKRTGAFREPTSGPGVTGHTLDEVMAAAPRVDDTNGASEADVIDGKTFWGLKSGVWGTRTGTLETQTLSADSTTVEAGNYAATTLDAVDPDLATGNIKKGATIFGVLGDTNVVNTGSGDAAAGDMLIGKKAWVAGSEVTGNVSAGSDVSGADGSKTFDIPDGLYTGSKTATANDTQLEAINIKSGVDIFGVVGSAVVSSGNAVVADVLSTKTFSNSSSAGLTGRMPDREGDNASTAQNAFDGVNNFTAPEGYYDGDDRVYATDAQVRALDPDLSSENIRSTVTIFGVLGNSNVLDTSTGFPLVPAEMNRMRTGDIAFVNGSMLMGNGTKELSATSETVKAGYYEADTLSNIDKDLIAANIKNGVTIFGVNGRLITGFIKIPKTGETGCWDNNGNPINCTGTGQDGEYQLGVSPQVPPGGGYDVFTVYGWTGIRFTDNQDGTVTDNLTGLIWLKNADCFGSMDWTQALGACNNLANGSCGLTDGSSTGAWRLPNINELHSLADLSKTYPAVRLADGWDNCFDDVQVWGLYWSSTTSEGRNGDPPRFGYAWYLYTFQGIVYDGRKNDADQFYVWPVRSAIDN